MVYTFEFEKPKQSLFLSLSIYLSSLFLCLCKLCTHMYRIGSSIFCVLEECQTMQSNVQALT